ncbi:MAG: C-GCAxxG-C-C family protein [Actinomycetota bacterium]|nr:C-GCAxxG-C-C family protein [Actinomycetota bacterium]
MSNAEKARLLAEKNFRSGFNCAESVLVTFCQLTGRPIDEVLPLTTGFGGGIGRSGCLCGALAGAIIAIGLLHGRRSPKSDKHPAYDHASKLHKRFVTKFGSTCCRVLNKMDFKSEEHVKRCANIISETAGLLFEELGCKIHLSAI